MGFFRALGICALCATAQARSCQIRNNAGEPVNFYWVSPDTPTKYIKQSKAPLPHLSSSSIKTFEGHRFFVAWADEANDIDSWSAHSIPTNIQFVHRGFDQVVIAKMDGQGALYIDDWDMHEGEMTRLTKAISNCTNADEKTYAKCVEKVGARTISKLEQERDMIQDQIGRMQERLATAFCGPGQFASPSLRNVTHAGKPAEVLAETADVTLYRFREHLSQEVVEAMELNESEEGEQVKEVWPKASFKYDRPLIGLVEDIKSFIRQELPYAELSDEFPGEPLRFFSFNEFQIHAPPCNGHCPLMAKQPTEYVATLLAFAQVPTSGGTWKFTLPDKGEVAYVPTAGDAVLFLWKTQGYKPHLLPHLVACPVGEGKEEKLSMISRWIEGSTDRGNEDRDEL